jgi:multiple sugar transport system permease protein
MRKKGYLWTSKSRLAYLFILPATVFLLIFMIYPTANVIIMSFYKTDKMRRMLSFIGFRNYVELLREKEFLEIIFRSVYWTFIAVAAKTIFGMIMALLLNIEYTGRKIARTLLIIPWASSVPISALLWLWVYNPEFGLLTSTLKSTGLWRNPPIWLGDIKWAFIATIWVDIWIGIPFMALVFLAGMQSIPNELYEAADIDGANLWQRFFYVTFPGIRNVFLIATLLSCLWTFNDFNVIYILTKGGPVGLTHILITYTYENTFAWLKWNYGAVMAVVTLVILSLVSLIYGRIYFREEGE